MPRTMPTVAALALLGIATAGLASPSPTPAPASPPRAPRPAMKIDRLAWLAGCWTDSREGARVEEQWMAPAGGSMIGMSRTVQDGRTVAVEHMRIEEKGGVLVFTATPSSQPETSFTATELGDASVTFSSPEHDFPQRVIYRKVTGGRIAARIEGQDHGKDKAVDFPYAHAACPGAR